MAKEVSIQEESKWLLNSAVVTCRIQFDVLLIKSILNDMNIVFESVSLMGDNRVLITFASNKFLYDFITTKDSFKEFFHLVDYWSSKVQSSKKFLWINVIEIPLQFWNLEFFNIITDFCGEFISLVEPTLSRRRFVVPSLLISTFQNPIPSILYFKVNGKDVTLHIVENATDVKMAEDDVDDDSSESSGRSEEEAVSISEDDLSVKEVNPTNSTNLKTPDFEESTTKDSPRLEELSDPSIQKSNPDFTSEENKEPSGATSNGPSLITSRKPACQRKKKRISLFGSLKTDYLDTLSDSYIKKRYLAIITSLNNFTSIIEAVKTWDVGALLSLFNEKTRLGIENLIQKNHLRSLRRR